MTSEPADSETRSVRLVQPDDALTRLLRSDDQPAPVQASDGAPLRPGSTIGRYVVLRELGRGGMGVVYAAYDPQLDRKVALKRLTLDVLANRHGDDDDPVARLLREARSLARLSHPNVVQVYETGEHEGIPHIVMELIDGLDLRAWAREPQRSWQEILARLVEAGRGLAAAHEAGLLHRDFKPTNVLVGRDGRVRVVDFGLAKRPAEWLDELDPELAMLPSADEIPVARSLAEPLTEYGTVIGTVPYMAPEQYFLRAPVDARVDQYAFCVAAWELLTGNRPFRGTRRAMLRNKREGPPAWPAGSEVPRRIVEALRRGLASRPMDRWPSMMTLLEELQPRSMQRGWWLAGVGLAFAGGGALAAAMLMGDAPCGGARARIEQVWSDEARTAVERGLRGSELPFALDTWARIEPALDDYAEAWISLHTESCEATAVRREQSTEMLDLRMACLERSRDALRATVDALAEPDALLVEQAIDVVGGLPPLDRCATVEPLRLRVPPPEDPRAAAELERLQLELARAEVQRTAGRYDRARALLEPLQDPARALAHPPFTAQLALALGESFVEQGQLRAAVGQLESAYVDATASGEDELAAQAAMALAKLWANELADADQGLTWATTALAVSGRLQGDERLEAAALQSAGVVLGAAGDATRGASRLRQAVALLERQPDRGGPRLARALRDLGVALRGQGHFDEALRVTERAWQLDERHYGIDHPSTINALNNVGSMLLDMGRYHEALAVLERALAQTEASGGAETLRVVAPLNNLGIVSMYLGDTEGATRYLERALAAAEQAYGPQHPEVAGKLVNLAAVLHTRGGVTNAVQGVAYVRRAIEIGEQTMGAKHPTVAEYHTALGLLLVAADQPEPAIEAYRHALELQRGALAPSHPALAMSLRSLGVLYLQQGSHVEAEAVLRQALEIRLQTLGADHPDIAMTRLELGEALAALGREDEARTQLQRVVDGLGPTQGGETYEKAKAWLEAHPEPTETHAVRARPSQAASRPGQSSAGEGASSQG